MAFEDYFRQNAGNVGQMQPVSNSPVKNAANAQVTGDANSIKQVQRALGVPQTGAWDSATQSAFAKDGNSKLYSQRMTGPDGKGYTAYGVVNTGNAVSPWANESERRAANNSWLSPYGYDAETNYSTFDENMQPIFRGVMGSDGMGGVFNPAGYSSNPYYLQANIGATRDKLAGTAAAGLPDDLLKRAYDFYQPYANDMYLNPDQTGFARVSSMNMGNGVKVGDVRQALAKATGQVANYNNGWADSPAQFAKPAYYDGTSLNSSLGDLQSQLLYNLQLQDAINGGGGTTGTVTATPSTGNNSGNVQTSQTKPKDDEELRRYFERLMGLEGY